MNGLKFKWLKGDQVRQMSHLIWQVGNVDPQYHGVGIMFEYIEPVLYWYGREVYDKY